LVKEFINNSTKQKIYFNFDISPYGNNGYFIYMFTPYILYNFTSVDLCIK